MTTEHRSGRRLDADVGVRFVALPATIGSGRLTDISLTGAFLQTASKLRLASMVYIEGLDSGKERGTGGGAKRLAATVVRRCNAGVGLEWRFPYASPLPESAPAAEQAQFAETDTAGGVERRVYRLEFID